MTGARCLVRRVATWILSLGVLLGGTVLAGTVHAWAQGSNSPIEGRVVVIGEGSISVAPDYARIRGGVTTAAKTVKEASDANSKLMTAVTAALLDSGIAQKDIQTLQFSIQPVYAPQTSPAEPKLSGYRVSNQVDVAIHQISKVSEILDRLVTAGATDVGNVEFLLSDPSKALDQAREAAVADARRKAELYAHASGFSLGRVAWITENSEFEPTFTLSERQRSAAKIATAPIEPGENTLQARITVAFDIMR